MKNGLDFSVLDALAEKRSATSRQDASKGSVEYETIAGGKNTPQAPANAPQAPCGKSGQTEPGETAQKGVPSRQTEEYRARQAAIRRGGACITEIITGIQRGEAPEDLLLKACKAIAGMTGDTTFYETIRTGLMAIYGNALLKPRPLEWELEEVTKRLAMLTRPELDAEPEDGKKRIAAAVRAHTARALLLQARIEAATKGTTNG